MLAPAASGQAYDDAPELSGAAMRRREFIKVIAGSAAAGPLGRHAAIGKSPAHRYLSPAGAMPRDEAFRHRLQELGYVDGKNIIIEYRFAEGKFDRLRALAEELVRLEVDVIVTAVTQASLAAKHATRTIPIVFAAVSDLLGTGLVASRRGPRQCHWNRCYERRCCGKIA